MKRYVADTHSILWHLASDRRLSRQARKIFDSLSSQDQARNRCAFRRSGGGNQDYKATYRIDTGELLAGFLPRRQQRLVEAWIELYQEELLENWNLVEAGEPIKKVPPLKREER